MKKLLVLASLLLSTFSAHATVVAEDTAEHTINFTFGRPTADTYLCQIWLDGSEGSNLDTLTLPNGDVLIGDGSAGGMRIFTRENSPISSTLHLGSSNYGSGLRLYFCHDFKVPSENPGGMLETLYKVQTPAAWTFFTNSDARFMVYSDCSLMSYGNTNWLSLSSNTASDYIPFVSTPFDAGQAVDSTSSGCYTRVHILEFATGPRPPNETAGNITVGVKDVINFN